MRASLVGFGALGTFWKRARASNQAMKWGFTALVMLACGASTPAPTAPSTPTPTPTPTSTPTFLDANGGARLSDGTRVETENESVVFHAANGSWSRNSYIGASEAEVIEGKWLFSRDASGRGSILPWTPNAVSSKPGQPIDLALGEHAIVGDWKVEWVGVIPGSGEQTGQRVMALQATYQEEITNQWQMIPKSRGSHDFVTGSGLHRLEVAVASAAFEKEPSSSRLSIRAREVDRAKSAKFGVALAPGFYAFPDGLHVSMAKRTLCGMGVVCVCRDVLTGYVAFGESEGAVSLVDGTTTEYGHAFKVAGGNVTITKAP